MPAGPLALPEPQTVTAGAGFLKIKAKAEAGKKVGFSVFGVFADGKTQPQWEVIGDDTIILGIPGVEGAVLVTAAVDGNPPVLVSTTVTINPAKVEEPVSAPVSKPVTGKLYAIVVAPAGDTASLKAALAKLDVITVPLSAGDQRLASPAIAAETAKAKGGPVLILQDAGGTIHYSGKMLPDGDVLALVKKLREGK